MWSKLVFRSCSFRDCFYFIFFNKLLIFYNLFFEFSHMRPLCQEFHFHHTKILLWKLKILESWYMKGPSDNTELPYHVCQKIHNHFSRNSKSMIPLRLSCLTCLSQPKRICALKNHTQFWSKCLFYEFMVHKVGSSSDKRNEGLKWTDWTFTK